jgi:hypothetical protein
MPPSPGLVAFALTRALDTQGADRINSATQTVTFPNDTPCSAERYDALLLRRKSRLYRRRYLCGQQYRIVEIHSTQKWSIDDAGSIVIQGAAC